MSKQAEELTSYILDFAHSQKDRIKEVYAAPNAFVFVPMGEEDDPDLDLALGEVELKLREDNFEVNSIPTNWLDECLPEDARKIWPE